MYSLVSGPSGLVIPHYGMSIALLIKPNRLSGLGLRGPLLGNLESMFNVWLPLDAKEPHAIAELLS